MSRVSSLWPAAIFAYRAAARASVDVPCSTIPPAGSAGRKGKVDLEVPAKFLGGGHLKGLMRICMRVNETEGEGMKSNPAQWICGATVGPISNDRVA